MNNSFKNELDSGKESLKNLADEIMGKVSKVYSDIKNGIKMRHNSRIDKLERLLNYPDAVINEILSKILHKDVNIRFKIIENLRANNNLNIDLSKFKWEINDNEVGISPFFIISDDEKTDNPFEAVLKALVIGFEIDFFTEIFTDIVKSFKLDFDFNTWYKDLSTSVKDYFNEIIINSVTIMNTMFSQMSTDLISKLSDLFQEWSLLEIVKVVIGEEFSDLLDVFDLFESIDENFNNYYVEFSFIATFADFISYILCIMIPGLSFGSDFLNEIIKKSLSNIESGKLWG